MPGTVRQTALLPLEPKDANRLWRTQYWLYGYARFLPRRQQLSCGVSLVTIAWASYALLFTESSWLMLGLLAAGILLHLSVAADCRTHALLQDAGCLGHRIDTLSADHSRKLAELYWFYTRYNFNRPTVEAEAHQRLAADEAACSIIHEQLLRLLAQIKQWLEHQATLDTESFRSGSARFERMSRQSPAARLQPLSSSWQNRKRRIGTYRLAHALNYPLDPTLLSILFDPGREVSYHYGKLFELLAKAGVLDATSGATATKVCSHQDTVGLQQLLTLLDTLDMLTQAVIDGLLTRHCAGQEREAATDFALLEQVLGGLSANETSAPNYHADQARQAINQQIQPMLQRVLDAFPRVNRNSLQALATFAESEIISPYRLRTGARFGASRDPLPIEIIDLLRTYAIEQYKGDKDQRLTALTQLLQLLRIKEPLQATYAALIACSDEQLSALVLFVEQLATKQANVEPSLNYPIRAPQTSPCRQTDLTRLLNMPVETLKTFTTKFKNYQTQQQWYPHASGEQSWGWQQWPYVLTVLSALENGVINAAFLDTLLTNDTSAYIAAAILQRLGTTQTIAEGYERLHKRPYSGAVDEQQTRLICFINETGLNQQDKAAMINQVLAVESYEIDQLAALKQSRLLTKVQDRAVVEALISADPETRLETAQVLQSFASVQRSLTSRDIDKLKLISGRTTPLAVIANRLENRGELNRYWQPMLDLIGIEGFDVSILQAKFNQAIESRSDLATVFQAPTAAALVTSSAYCPGLPSSS